MKIWLMIIGAGAVVVKDIRSDVTAVGNPARVIRCHTQLKNEGSTAE